MKRIAILGALLFLYSILHAANAPDNGVIIGIAQHFVAEKLNLPPESHFSIAFDIAYVHAQPEHNYWAVVGGFMAELSANEYEPHSYVAAVRLICPDYQNLECWRLEKLALDNRILFDVDQS